MAGTTRIQTLSTSRYVQPGTYIGQLLRPRPTNLSADARLPAGIGRGSRLSLQKNLGIRRSFVFDEQLAFPLSAPFEAVLDFSANGNQLPPVRLFKQDGTAVRIDQWTFVDNTAVVPTVPNGKVLVSPEVFDNTATYFIDYQSTSRLVNEPVPLEELRDVRQVGLQENASGFIEFEDYFIETGLTDPIGDSGNTNATTDLEVPVPDGGNAGTGVITQNAGSAYTHNYNRFYQLECTAAAGGAGTFTATFAWIAIPVSGGASAQPPVPLDAPSIVNAPTVSIDEATVDLTKTLENGIVVDFAVGGANFSVGDIFRFNARGPALIERDPRYDNTNQFLATQVPVDDPGNTGLGVMTADGDLYTGIFNTNFSFEVIAVAGGVGTFTGTILWAQSGELGASGSVAYAEVGPVLTFTLALGVDITVDVSAGNFAIGDKFTFWVRPPRIFYQKKDERDYTLSVTTATNPAAGNGFIQGTYVTNTPEGSFGTFDATADDTPNGIIIGQVRDANDAGSTTLPDNVALIARNMFDLDATTGLAQAAGNRHTVADIFRFSTFNSNVINWSLTKKVSETLLATEILTDVTGAVTGTPGTFYIILGNVPTAGTVVVEDLTMTPVTSVEILGTPFVSFVTNPGTTLVVTYEHRGAEPDPGALYFFTGTFIRPEEFFNSPQLILDRDDGRRLLAPSTAENHLFIANEIAFDQNVFGWYAVQVKDADGDGIFTNNDFKEALLSTEAVFNITDLIVLNNFGSLSDSLSINLKANDPFEKREQLLWVGTPIGTPIGNDQTPGTLIFLARKTLQVFGNSPAHGNRIIVSPTEAVKTVRFDDDSDQQVTLDGSFVAFGTACAQAGFADPAETILRKNLAGFDSLQTYTEPENILMGQASITYLSDQGNNVFRYEEDITVDTTAIEFNLISARTQIHFVVRVVRREMDAALISVVVPSAAAGVGFVRSTLSSILLGLLGRSRIAAYQDDGGNERRFDNETDVVVFRDEIDPTLYHFFFAFFIKFPIKRLFGLFSVNSNDFGLAA